MAALSEVTSFSDKRLLVVGVIEQGFGDISATVKILEVFKKHFPLENLALTLFCRQQKYDSLSLFENSIRGIRVINSCEPDECYESIKKFQPSLAILFHGIYRVREKEGLIFHHTKKDPIQVPAIVFEEYNYFSSAQSTSSARCYSLGINCLGIFQDEELVRYSQNPENRQSLHRLKTYTSKLHPNLSQAVLGKENVEEFDKSNALYFGYCSDHGHKTKIVYIGAMVSLNKETKENLTVILPGTLGASRYKDGFQNFLKEENFGSLELMIWNEKEGQSRIFEKIDLNPAGSRRLRIIAGTFSHDHFIQLMLASEREVLCTGDQSLGEALSAGKKIYYEELGHKGNLSRSLSEVIAREGSVGGVSFMYNRVLKAGGVLRKRMETMKLHYVFIHPTWDRVIDHIHQSQNCEKRIVSVVKDWL